MPKKPHPGEKVGIITKFEFPKMISCYTGDVKDEHGTQINPDTQQDNPKDKISCITGDSVDTNTIKFYTKDGKGEWRKVADLSDKKLSE